MPSMKANGMIYTHDFMQIFHLFSDWFVWCETLLSAGKSAITNYFRTTIRRRNFRFRSPLIRLINFI